VRDFNEVGNMRHRENSDRITTAETTHENNSPIQAGTYDLTYHTKQWGKGLLVFGAGLLGYVGFSAFFGNRREASTVDIEGVVDGNLAFPNENLLNMQATISGISTALDHQEPKEFVPTSFSTSRTLLSLREKKGAQDVVEIAYRSTDAVKADNAAHAPKSTRRAIPQFTYQGGNEFQVNTYTTDIQYRPSVTSLTNGSFVVVWTSWPGQDGSSDGVYGQRYNSTGQPVGFEFPVNTNTFSSQYDPAVASLTEGGFMVVWTSYNQDGIGNSIYGQRYDATGFRDGNEFKVNDYGFNDQTFPSITRLIEGGFVVVWEDEDGQDGSFSGVYGQRYNATGQPAGSEFQVNTYTTSSQKRPRVSGFIEGGFVVVWQSWQDGDGYGVYGQRYNATGQPMGPEFQVNTYTSSYQYSPAVASLTEGGFVVVWLSDGQNGSSTGVYGQVYNAMGQPTGSEFDTFTIKSQEFPVVTSLTEGGFVVLWVSDGQDSSSEKGVYGRRYNAMGQPVSAEFRANNYTTSTQSVPSVVSLAGGRFVVVWESNGQDGDSYGVFGRIFSPLFPPPPLPSNNALIIGIITGSIVGGLCLCLTASAIVLILPVGIWYVKQKQGKLVGKMVQIPREQDNTELKDTDDIIAKQAGLEKGEPTATPSTQRLFQPPVIASQPLSMQGLFQPPSIAFPELSVSTLTPHKNEETTLKEQNVLQNQFEALKEPLSFLEKGEPITTASTQRLFQPPTIASQPLSVQGLFQLPSIAFPGLSVSTLTPRKNEGTVLKEQNVLQNRSEALKNPLSLSEKKQDDSAQGVVKGRPENEAIIDKEKMIQRLQESANEKYSRAKITLLQCQYKEAIELFSQAKKDYKQLKKEFGVDTSHRVTKIKSKLVQASEKLEGMNVRLFASPKVSQDSMHDKETIVSEAQFQLDV